MILVWIAAVFLAVVFIVLLVLLFMPFWLEINTINNVYEVRAGRLFIAGVNVPEEGRPDVYLKLFGRKIQTKKEKKVAQAEKQKKHAGKRRRIKAPKDMNRRIIAVLHSFRVKMFFIDIDTGNFIINAWLYPACYVLKQIKGANMNINFAGRSETVVLVQNTAFRIIKAFITKK